MTESQKAFEADYIARDNGSGIMSPKHDDDTYFSNFQQEAWEKWQAAEAYGRKKALEELEAERKQVAENIKQIESGGLKP